MNSRRERVRRLGRMLPGGARVWVFVVLGLAAIAVVAIIFAMSLPGRRGGDPGATILEMSGRGNETSEKFYARQGWSIEWENTGQYFSYTIHGDVEFGQVITQNGAGNGITSPVPTGTFFIEVVAQGPWSIKVIQGD
jgi:hypothetical protein